MLLHLSKKYFYTWLNCSLKIIEFLIYIYSSPLFYYAISITIYPPYTLLDLPYVHLKCTSLYNYSLLNG